jgi:hypothetical protein
MSFSPKIKSPPCQKEDGYDCNNINKTQGW